MPNVSINSTGANAAGPIDPVAEQPFVNTSEYRVLAANDLGMHCADLDYQIFSILPPFYVVHAQVIQRGTQDSLPSVVDATDVEVVFNADVADATAIRGNFTLVEDPDGAATEILGGTFVFDDASSTITYTPPDLLTYGIEYEVTLDGNIANEDGSLLSEWSAAGGGDYSYRFTVDPTEFRS